MVLAALAGEVVFVGDVPSYDTLIVIRHPDEDLWTYYGHVFRPKVTAGDVVETGRIIGQVGEDSVTGEYHLHFEVRFLGLSLDPPAFLPEFEIKIRNSPGGWDVACKQHLTASFK